MAKAALLTSETPSGLLDTIVRRVAGMDPGERWTIVVPRTHLRREVVDLLQRHTGRTAWIGPRVMLLDDLVEHYARQLDAIEALTALQVRQVLAACIADIHEATGGEMLAGQVVDGRVSEGLLTAQAALFSELEPFGLSAEALEERLRGEGDSLTQRGRELVELYRLYSERVLAHGFRGPQARAVIAAEAARRLLPPSGVRKLVFVGLDGSSVANVGVRLFWALHANKEIEEVDLALVLPEDVAASAWRTHANLGIHEDWSEAGGRRIVLPAGDGFGSLPVDLAALATNPFDYQSGEVVATGAVRVVRVPDTQVEVEWLARELKRRVLDEGVSPDDIAVVARDMADRVGDLADALDSIGLPVVASRELRARELPAVRALLAPFRLVAEGWRPEDVVAAASSPYLAAEANPTLLAWIAARGETPRNGDEWAGRIEAMAEEARRERVRDLGGFRAEAIDSTLTAFRAFQGKVSELAGPFPAQAPAAWVESLARAVELFSLQARVEEVAEVGGVADKVRLIAQDIDGLNAVLHASHDWLRGREVAGLSDEPMSAREWLGELEAIAAETKVRSSHYPQESIALVDAAQAGLRTWGHVYVIGLADGMFPARDRDERTLAEEERRALRLADREERSARERLYFHLAVGAAKETLTLVSPAADDRGKALVSSPFVAALPLRIAGLVVEQVTAHDLMVGTVDLALSPRDLDAVAARQAQAGAVGAEVALWLSARPGAREAIAAWAIERARHQAASGHDCGDMGAYAGLFRPEDVPSWLVGADAAFSPSDLEEYAECPRCFFVNRVLGLRDPNGGGEAAAFGSLQHRILERLYRGLGDDGLLPPATEADVDTAISRLEEVAEACVQERTPSAHAGLWTADLAYTLADLRRYVRRDLEAMLRRESDDASEELRTEVVGLELWAGGDEKPVRVKRGDVEFRLRGKLDRVERIADPRLTGPAEAANGWLMVRDYKSSRSGWAPGLKQFLEGSSLQLPLYAYMAEETLGAEVFGLGEIRTALGDDPSPVVERVAEPTPDGQITLRPSSDAAIVGGKSVVRAVVNAALARAAEMVARVRQGKFSARTGKKCWNCTEGQVGRRSVGRQYSQRSSTAVVVTPGEMAAAKAAKKAGQAA